MRGVLSATPARTTWRFPLEVGEITPDVPDEVLGLRDPHRGGDPSVRRALDRGAALATDGKVLTYSGDTEWTDALIPIADGADLFIMRMLRLRPRSHRPHEFRPLQAKRASFARRIMLTHMNPTMLARTTRRVARASDRGGRPRDRHLVRRASIRSAERPFSRNCATVAFDLGRCSPTAAGRRTSMLRRICCVRTGVRVLDIACASDRSRNRSSRPNRASPSSSATPAYRAGRAADRAQRRGPRRRSACAASASRSSRAPTSASPTSCAASATSSPRSQAARPRHARLRLFLRPRRSRSRARIILLGVDARLERESDIADRGGAAVRPDALRSADSPARAKVMMIDAARPLPFRPQGRALATRACRDRAAAGHADRLLVRARHASRRTGRARPTAPMPPPSPRCCARRAPTSTPHLHAHPQPHPSRRRKAQQTPWHISALSEPIELVPPEAAARRPCRRRRRSARRGRCARSVPTRPMRSRSRWTRSKATPSFVEAYPAPSATRSGVWAMIRARREALAWMRARADQHAASLLDLSAPLSERHVCVRRRAPPAPVSARGVPAAARFRRDGVRRVPMALEGEPLEYDEVYRVPRAAAAHHDGAAPGLSRRSAAAAAAHDFAGHGRGRHRASVARRAADRAAACARAAPRAAAFECELHAGWRRWRRRDDPVAAARASAGAIAAVPLPIRLRRRKSRQHKWHRVRSRRMSSRRASSALRRARTPGGVRQPPAAVLTPGTQPGTQPGTWPPGQRPAPGAIQPAPRRHNSAAGGRDASAAGQSWYPAVGSASAAATACGDARAERQRRADHAAAGAQPGTQQRPGFQRPPGAPPPGVAGRTPPGAHRRRDAACRPQPRPRRPAIATSAAARATDRAPPTVRPNAAPPPGPSRTAARPSPTGRRRPLRRPARRRRGRRPTAAGRCRLGRRRRRRRPRRLRAGCRPARPPGVRRRRGRPRPRRPPPHRRHVQPPQDGACVNARRALRRVMSARNDA